jgi:hypothetical protein
LFVGQFIKIGFGPDVGRLNADTIAFERRNLRMCMDCLHRDSKRRAAVYGGVFA